MLATAKPSGILLHAERVISQGGRSKRRREAPTISRSEMISPRH